MHYEISLFDGKNVSLIASIASFVCAGVSLIGALLCLIGKKKTTATIFAALSCIAAAVGAVTAYTLRLAEESSDVFDGFDPYDYDEDDSDDEDEDDGTLHDPDRRDGKRRRISFLIHIGGCRRRAHRTYEISPLSQNGLSKCVFTVRFHLIINMRLSPCSDMTIRRIGSSMPFRCAHIHSIQ